MPKVDAHPEPTPLKAESPAPPSSPAEEKKPEQAPVEQAPKAELKKDGNSEAAKEFAPGVVPAVSTGSTAAVPTPTAPSIAKLTGNDGGGLV